MTSMHLHTETEPNVLFCVISQKPGFRIRIQIHSGRWIRIRIRNPDPDLRGQKLPTKVEKK
jgi:hypothetical protein